MSLNSWYQITLDLILIGMAVGGLVLSFKVRRTLKQANRYLEAAQAYETEAKAALEQATQRLRAAGIAAMIVEELNGEPHRPETLQ